jgi:hypothetical protein
MTKNILILTGSPRKGGNSDQGDILKTDGLIRAENLGKSMISGETA